MTDELPPPDVDTPAPGVPEASGLEPNAPESDVAMAGRPALVHPAAAWIAGGAATVALLVTLCSGSFALIVPVALQQMATEFARDAETLRAEYEAQEAAEELLLGLQDRVMVTYRARREFPSSLPESPPADPWDTPIRYERAGPDRAWLTSAGPDREFGTGDDIGFDLEPE